MEAGEHGKETQSISVTVYYKVMSVGEKNGFGKESYGVQDGAGTQFQIGSSVRASLRG